MKYILYARTATTEQTSPNGSLDYQVNFLKEYAGKQGLEIGKVITEVGSGITTDRSGLKNLVKEISTGEYKGILCANVDRISRNFQSFLDIYKQAIDKNMEIITPMGIYKASPKGEFANKMFQVLSEQYQSEVSERIKRGIRQAKLHKQ